MDKIDVEKSGGEFWKEVNRMLGRGARTTIGALNDENGKDLKTEKEVVLAFKRRMEKTVRISEEENENFCPINEREVEGWL